MIGKTLNWYIAKHIIKALIIAFLIVTSIIMLVDFVESSRNLDSDSDISTFSLFFLTILKTPKLIEQTIPFIVLFGVMGALFGMNKRSELIVIRAAGVSVWKFLRPALYVTGALGVFWAAGLNPIATYLSDKHNNLNALWGQNDSNEKANSIWLRSGDGDRQSVIFAERLDVDTQTLILPTFYILRLNKDGSTDFDKRYDAKTAMLTAQGYWVLNEVTENVPRKKPQIYATLSLPTQITTYDLIQKSSQRLRPAFWSIPAAISANEAAGFSSRALRMQFNKLLALPVTLIAMTFIAAAVSMHLTREGGSLRLLIAGSIVGFVVYFMDNVISAFGDVAILPVLVASWTIPLFILFFGISYLARLEDG